MEEMLRHCDDDWDSKFQLKANLHHSFDGVRVDMHDPGIVGVHCHAIQKNKIKNNSVGKVKKL